MKPRNNSPHWLSIFKNTAALPQPIAQIDRATVLSGPGATAGVQTGIGIGAPLGSLVGGPVGAIAGTTIGIVAGLIAGSAIGRALGNFLDIRSSNRRMSAAEESMFENIIIERLMKMAFLIDGYLEEKFRKDTADSTGLDGEEIRKELRRSMSIGKISYIETCIFENIILLRLAEHYGELNEIEVIKCQLKEYFYTFIQEFKIKHDALEKIKTRVNPASEFNQVTSDLLNRRPIDNKLDEGKFSISVMINFYATKSLDWIRLKYCEHDAEMQDVDTFMNPLINKSTENIEACEIRLMEGKQLVTQDEDSIKEDDRDSSEPQMRI